MLKEIVADASAIVEYLFRTDRAPAFQEIFEDPDVDVHVPSLCDVEVASALRRALRTRRMDVGHANLILIVYLQLPLIRHGHMEFLSRALDLRENFTAYDAMYVALAERLGAALMTGDDRLGQSARRHTTLETLPASR